MKKFARGLFIAVSFSASVGLSAAHFAEFSHADVTAMVAGPPASPSLVQDAELEVILQLQAARTPAQAARAGAIDGEDIFFFGRDVLGEEFTAASLPKTAALFALVREDFLELNRTAKAAFQRRRPPFIDHRVQPCIRFTDSGSYPSGHGMQSALWSHLLAELAPQYRDKFFERARESRWSRLVAGVHFPTDVEAGRVIGEAFAKEVIASQEFQTRAAAVRKELGNAGVP